RRELEALKDVLKSTVAKVPAQKSSTSKETA
ncbi:MAG: hypothetical protein ACI9OJ_003291, partial [Myxococcota bacterium]